MLIPYGGFLKWGAPPNHQFFHGFFSIGNLETIHFWGTPILGKPHTRWGPPNISWFINHEITPSNSFVKYLPNL